MLNFIIRKLLGMIPMLLIITLLIYASPVTMRSASMAISGARASDSDGSACGDEPRTDCCF